MRKEWPIFNVSWICEPNRDNRTKPVFTRQKISRIIGIRFFRKKLFRGAEITGILRFFPSRCPLSRRLFISISGCRFRIISKSRSASQCSVFQSASSAVQVLGNNFRMGMLKPFVNVRFVGTSQKKGTKKHAEYFISVLKPITNFQRIRFRSRLPL